MHYLVSASVNCELIVLDCYQSQSNRITNDMSYHQRHVFGLSVLQSYTIACAILSRHKSVKTQDHEILNVG
jgi:hypothetical protein